jgi:feruloyl esterase
MLPAVGHCSGGQGPDQADYMGALEQWREKGAPPASIIAQRKTNNRVEMARPLCPYPQVAVYKGEGSTDEAGSFECRMPERIP